MALQKPKREQMSTRIVPDRKAVTHLDLVVEAAGWKRIPKLRARLQLAARAVYAHLPAKLRIPFAATVLLSENAAVRRLNHDFRGIDKPTNVLSFPQHTPAELPKLGKNRTVIELGDIALAYRYVAKESKENNKLILNHVTHLVIHGLLHLFGYDHIIDAEADRMETLETRIMESLGLPDPYRSQPDAPRAAVRRKTTPRKK